MTRRATRNSSSRNSSRNPINPSQLQKRIREERDSDRALFAKEKETVEIDVVPEEVSPKKANSEGEPLTPEMLGKRENTNMVTPHDTKKVKVTMGQVNPPVEALPGQPQLDPVNPEFPMSMPPESKVTGPGQNEPPAGQSEQIGDMNKFPKMGGMPPMMYPMMYPFPGNGECRERLMEGMNMENGVMPNPNMMPGQMFPHPMYYPQFMMGQGMMPPYPPMNMGFQYPGGFPQMPFMNQPNLMQNLKNGEQPVNPNQTEPVQEPMRDPNIHTENPLKVIKKPSVTDNQKENAEADSEKEDAKEHAPKGEIGQMEPFSNKENQKEITGTQRIEFDESEDDEETKAMNTKPKINAIPNEKVEEDVRKKEEIVAKELTEKEILMNKVKNQKALEEIKMDKKILKILAEIAKKIPKKKSRLLRNKIKWSLLEKVQILTPGKSVRAKTSFVVEPKVDRVIGSRRGAFFGFGRPVA